MGLFDTIEVTESIKDGPDAGVYQTKDLGSYLDNYFIYIKDKSQNKLPWRPPRFPKS